MHDSLKKAVAFIDYEHWYISLVKNFGLKPDIKGWFEDLSTRVYPTEAVFFADFSHKSLADEIRRIRPYSNKIIDTRSPTGVQKDFTDFIILDNIYQKALSSSDIEAFILFSGDGHFSSATSFLKNFYSKEVGIYGIQGSFSRQLQDTASWCVTLPTEEQLYGLKYRMIFAALRKTRKMATRKSLAEDICKSNRSVKKSEIDGALKRLIAEGYITERSVSSRSGKQAECLFVDWDKVDSGPYGEI